MKYPNLNEEKKLWKKGYKKIAGIDEAGRGPLAGPVVAAAVVFKKKSKISLFGVKDSKKLNAEKREEIYSVLKKDKNINWSVAKVSDKIIDKINILEATKLAMKKAIEKLEIKPDYLILDGKTKVNTSVPQKTIVNGDNKVFSCAAASIIAKVTRDRLMVKLHKKYPEYGFEKHKGYGTKLHKKKLKKYGPCKIHRKSFSPIKGF